MFESQSWMLGPFLEASLVLHILGKRDRREDRNLLREKKERGNVKVINIED